MHMQTASQMTPAMHGKPAPGSFFPIPVLLRNNPGTRTWSIFSPTAKMHLKSMYPPIPPPGDQNVHDFIFRRPDVAEWPDFTAQIDATTGKKRSFREFLERVYDGATALGAQEVLGLRAEDNEIVGILSDNCLVRNRASW
jgi:hypothetical protein